MDGSLWRFCHKHVCRRPWTRRGTVSRSLVDAIQNSIFQWGVYPPTGTILYVNDAWKVMEKNCAQAVCGGVQFHKGSSSPLKPYLSRKKGLSLLFQNLDVFQPHSHTQASKLVTFQLFLSFFSTKEIQKRRRGDSGRPGTRMFVWCECVFCVITPSGWVPMLAR